MKNKFKDILLGSLGLAGLIIWYMISVMVRFTHLLFFDFSFLISFLVIMVLFIPFVGGITNFILWVWSFNIVLSKPIDGWSIFYFCMLALYVITTILPFVIQFILNMVALIINLVTNKTKKTEEDIEENTLI